MYNFPFGAPAPQLMAPGLVPGPVPAVPLTSGFHPPGTAGLGNLHMPPPEPGFNVKDGLALLSEGLAKFRPKGTPDPTKPGVPTPQGDPTGGAGPAFLGGTTSLGADLNGLLMKLDPLTGLPWPNSSWGTSVPDYFALNPYLRRYNLTPEQQQAYRRYLLATEQPGMNPRPSAQSDVQLVRAEGSPPAAASDNAGSGTPQEDGTRSQRSGYSFGDLFNR